MRKLLSLILALLFLSNILSAEEGFLSEFGSLEGWRLVNFEENLEPTQFEPMELGGQQILRVVSDGSASMIIREEPINVYETPYISWSWNLISPLEEADIRSIFREDTPIRILVTFRDEIENLPWWLRAWAQNQLEKHGELPPTSAINYVWSTQVDEEEPFKSMWSKRIQFIVKNSGEEGLGSWQRHRVNVIEDYRRAMGVDPPKEAFVAVMSDSDNTGEYAEAWVEYVRASSE